MTVVDYGDYLQQLDGDIRDLLATMAKTDLATSVPSCPGWSLGDLAFHLAEGYQHKIAAIHSDSRPHPWPPESPGAVWRSPVLEFLESSAENLLAELRSREPEQPCWTWYPEAQTVGFWGRRMAHETVIHRYDAESTFQQPTSIATAIATDGIDELLVVFLSGDWSDEPQPAPFGHVDVLAGTAGWRVTVTTDAVAVKAFPLMIGQRPASARLEGSAQTLLLSLWGRPTVPAPRVFGDAALVGRLRDRLALVTG